MCKTGFIVATLIGFQALFVSPAASAAETKEQPIGKIKWEIRDGWNFRALSNGEKTLFAKDVHIKDAYIKVIDLDKTFYFRYEETMQKDRKDSGFGFRCGRSDQETFSWEWFTVDRPGHAKKLQENGELLVGTSKTANGTEISHMEFLTDVSFRILRKGEWNPFNTTWRINVLKGSVINWPYQEKAPGITGM